MNKLHRLLMLIVLMMVSMASFGQEGKVKQLQIAIEDYDKVDTCEITRYATVRKDGKWGIYDLESKENVTEVDMDCDKKQMLSDIKQRNLHSIYVY